MGTATRLWWSVVWLEGWKKKTLILFQKVYRNVNTKYFVKMAGSNKNNSLKIMFNYRQREKMILRTVCVGKIEGAERFWQIQSSWK